MADPCIPRAGGHGVRVEPEDALFKMLEEGVAREYCPDLQNCPAGWQQTRVVRRGHDGGEAAPVTTAGTGSESYQLLVDSPGPQEGEVILSAAQVEERWVGSGGRRRRLCITPPSNHPPPATITFTLRHPPPVPLNEFALVSLQVLHFLLRRIPAVAARPQARHTAGRGRGRGRRRLSHGRPTSLCHPGANVHGQWERQRW